MSPLDNYTIRGSTVSGLPGESGQTVDPEEGLELENRSCSTCKNCPICCHLILSHYNLLTDAYHIIGLGYKFLLTLYVTQVACERTFSTLTFVKNRLRTSMTALRLFCWCQQRRKSLWDLTLTMSLTRSQRPVSWCAASLPSKVRQHLQRCIM